MRFQEPIPYGRKWEEKDRSKIYKGLKKYKQVIIKYKK